VIVQNAENFTVFFGPPSPKALARQGHLIPNAFQTERQLFAKIRMSGKNFFIGGAGG
jgi:hypothetical protein